MRADGSGVHATKEPLEGGPRRRCRLAHAKRHDDGRPVCPRRFRFGGFDSCFHGAGE